MKLSTILLFLFIIGTNLNANHELIVAFAGRQFPLQFIENLGQLILYDGRSGFGSPSPIVEDGRGEDNSVFIDHYFIGICSL